jgi:very-short-patch-repair endonuclease
VSRAQLGELGLGRAAIRHRVERGRLHLVWPGVFAVGRPELTREGRWTAAVLTCGEGAVLSHTSAGELWRILPERPGPVTLSVPAVRRPKRRQRIRVHRRSVLGENDVTAHNGIPVTTPTATLIDLAAQLSRRRLEAAVNEADKLDLIDPETLRATLDDAVRRPGTAALRRTLDRATYTRTDSDLERRFLRLAREAGLPRPKTQQQLNGFRVDFHWRDLKLVVETDGLRYHRTPAQQAQDRRRDQALTVAGLTVLRFTHGQVTHEPEHVTATLRALRR